MHKHLFSFGIFLFFTSMGAVASDLELAFGTESAAVDLILDPQRTRVGGTGVAFGALANGNDDAIIHVGMLAQGAPAGRSQPFSFHIGGKIYLGIVEEPDVSIQAFTLGLGAKYHVPGNMPLAFGGEIFYAPEITAIGDIDKFLDTRLRIELDLLPGAAIFIGVRTVSTNIIDHGKYDLDRSGHAGIRIQF